MLLGNFNIQSRLQFSTTGEEIFQYRRVSPNDLMISGNLSKTLVGTKDKLFDTSVDTNEMDPISS